ncbi:MAG: prepilin peptidase [Candidatus Magasanikbacteria bacterium]|nr:prepilin peptidase [Candidatus Magasanikbacteria bacterium]
MAYPIVAAIIVAITGAYLGALSDRFAYWFHVSRTNLWRKSCAKCFSAEWMLTFIPILGYLFRRGTCRSCLGRLPITSFAAEVGGMLVTLYTWFFIWGAGLPLAVLAWFHIGFLLFIIFGGLVLAISDLAYDELPFGLYVVILIAILTRLFLFDTLANLEFALFAGIFSGFVMALLVMISHWRWVHVHDILFGIFIGMIVGWPAFFVTLAIAYILAVLAGLVSWAWNTRSFRGTSSYGLYLFIALGLQALIAMYGALV